MLQIAKCIIHDVIAKLQMITGQMFQGGLNKGALDADEWTGAGPAIARARIYKLWKCPARSICKYWISIFIDR